MQYCNTAVGMENAANLLLEEIAILNRQCLFQEDIAGFAVHA
jgi:hypothetical protein